MRILDRLPYYEDQTEVILPDGTAPVRPYQIVVTVSISLRHVMELPDGAARFPAVLDTGHTHNLAIRQEQLDRWVGLPLPSAGSIFVGTQKIPLRAANVWIHPNRPGERDLSPAQTPFCLELEEGIGVYPREMPNPARLPLLGLRGLTKNNLKLIIDGESRKVTLETAGWS